MFQRLLHTFSRFAYCVSHSVLIFSIIKAITVLSILYVITVGGLVNDITRGRLDKELSTFGQAMQRIMCAVYITAILTNVILLISVCTRRSLLALPWLLFAVLSWIFMWITAVDLFVKYKKIHLPVILYVCFQIIFVPMIWVMVVYFYFLYKDRREIEEPEEEIRNQPQSKL